MLNAAGGVQQDPLKDLSTETEKALGKIAKKLGLSGLNEEETDEEYAE